MILLQASGTIQKGADVLFQYGILGLFTILLLYWFWYMEKLRRKREEESKEEKKELVNRITILETRFNDYQEHDRVRLEDLIDENTQVMKEVIQELKRK